jgi:hypothetical protein
MVVTVLGGWPQKWPATDHEFKENKKQILSFFY